LIPPVVFAKYRRADILPVKLIAQLQKSNSRLELVTPSVSRFSVLCFAVSVGFISLTLLDASLSSVVAQMRPGETTMSQVSVLFVNPSVGDDTGGNGSERAPLKTITEALRVATPNTVIMLSPGTYSTETGEVFPLILKPGVSIQGDAPNKGSGITIQGGGEYLSRSFGGQNVTIIGANQGRLTGVTVTNSNPRGYGLWIESSNPVIAENTFTGNTQDGISVTGKGSATINKNYFHQNGANGITIGGNSQPQVRENVFENTGFGINITQNAAPVVVGNQIQDNRSGILVQANARPILRNNLIQGNKEDGLVAIAQAMPDLGNATEVGKNEFRNNARYDINATAAKQAIAAAGNTLSSHRIAGQVDTNSQTAIAVNNSQPNALGNSAISQNSVNREITFSAPRVINTTKPLVKLFSNSIARDRSSSGQLNSRLLPLQPAKLPLNIPTYNQEPPTSRVGGFPIPSSLAPREASTNTQVGSREKLTPLPALQPDTPQLNYVDVDTNTIEFVAPQQPSHSAALGVREQRQLSPILETPPLGNPAILPVPTVPKTYTNAYGGDFLPPTRSKQIQGVRYRVVVEVASDRERDLVHLFAPEAFSTIWQGRRVMQAGVFSSRYNADEMLRTLSNQGLRSIIEPLN
jgi:parallel beta-helix repeat protein